MKQRMQWIALLMSGMIGLTWAAPPANRVLPVDNTVPPCDNTANRGKPDCQLDSDSVNHPPPTRDERGIVVPPEVPAEGLPNQDQRRQQQRLPADPPSQVPAVPSTRAPANELRN